MMFNPEHDKDVYQALNKFSDGVTFQALFSLTTMFVEERELSVFLNRKITNGDVYKTDRLYFLSEKHRTNTPSVTEEIRSLLKNENLETPVKEPKVVKSDYFKKTVVPPLKANPTNIVAEKRTVGSPDKKIPPVNGKPSGNFNRSSVCGKYAYIFYRFRLHEPLTNDDLRRLVNHDKFTDSAHYQAFHSLKRNNFIRQIEKGRNPTFIWTGEYAYPFSSIKTNDPNCMKYKPEEYFDLLKKERIPQASSAIPNPAISTPKLEVNTETSIAFHNTEVESNTGTFVSNTDSKETVEYLDSKILELEKELKILRRLRGMMGNVMQ